MTGKDFWRLRTEDFVAALFDGGPTDTMMFPEASDWYIASNTGKRTFLMCVYLEKKNDPPKDFQYKVNTSVNFS